MLLYRCFVAGLIILGVFSAGVGFTEDINTGNSVVATAENWLKLVDEGQYAESWEQTSQYFRTIVKKQAWEDSIRPLRESLGGVITRTLKSQEHTTTLPGAPDGEYVIIQFETSFENKKLAVETVTPMIDSDGFWRVSGYYIK